MCFYKSHQNYLSLWLLTHMFKCKHTWKFPPQTVGRWEEGWLEGTQWVERGFLACFLGTESGLHVLH